MDYPIHIDTSTELSILNPAFDPGIYGADTKLKAKLWERSGSVVESLTRDREVAGSSLTGVTVLWSLSKTHLS